MARRRGPRDTRPYSRLLAAPHDFGDGPVGHQVVEGVRVVATELGPECADIVGMPTRPASTGALDGGEVTLEERFGNSGWTGWKLVRPRADAPRVEHVVGRAAVEHVGHRHRPRLRGEHVGW